MTVLWDGLILERLDQDDVRVRLTYRPDGTVRDVNLLLLRFPEQDRSACLPGVRFTFDDSPVAPQCRLVSVARMMED